jgi:hypothetical protein
MFLLVKEMSSGSSWVGTLSVFSIVVSKMYTDEKEMCSFRLLQVPVFTNSRSISRREFLM